MWPAAAGGTAALQALQTYLRFLWLSGGRVEGRAKKTFTAVPALGYEGTGRHVACRRCFSHGPDQK